MNLESLHAICTSFPHVVEDIKWGADLCFNIGGKMFLVTGPDEMPVSASFKCSDADFEVLLERPGFKPAPYLARHKWVAIDDISHMSEGEWKHYARQAYDLVRGKLPKRMQLELGK